MPSEPHDTDAALRATATALRQAAGPPRRPVDPERVLARARQLRRRRTVLSAAGVAALVAPLVAVALLRPAGVVEFFDSLGGGDGVDATLEGREAPPQLLADGSPVEAVPGRVARRFPGPVVAARRDAGLAAAPPGPCTSTPLGRSADEHAAEVGRRLDALAARADHVSAHVGPAIATTLAVGHAPAPPAYTGAYAAVCVARHDGDGWRSEGLGVDHLYEPWTASSHLGDGGLQPPAVSVTAFEVPEGAAWAVQEQPGWWLAYEVAGDPWVLVHTPAPPEADAFPGARVVFTDAGGRVVGTGDSGPFALPADAPVFSPQVTDARIDAGRATAVRARLASGGPLAVCDDGHGVCVWLVAAPRAGDVLALAAAGPHPLDVPPLGAVGHCPAEGTFQGTSTRSVFDGTGALVAGPAPSGLHAYGVVVEGGRLLVDLATFRFGADADERTYDADAPRCADPVEPG